MVGYYYIHDNEDFDDIKETNSGNSSTSNTTSSTSQNAMVLPSSQSLDANHSDSSNHHPHVPHQVSKDEEHSLNENNVHHKNDHVDFNDGQNSNKPSQKPKLNYLNKKVSFYIYERTKIEPIRLTINDPETNNIDEADYQRIFFKDFGNMASYNRGIFNRKTPQTPEVYEAKLQTEYDDLTMTTIKDIKDYMDKNK